MTTKTKTARLERYNLMALECEGEGTGLTADQVRWAARRGFKLTISRTGIMFRAISRRSKHYVTVHHDRHTGAWIARHPGSARRFRTQEGTAREMFRFAVGEL